LCQFGLDENGTGDVHLGEMRTFLFSIYFGLVLLPVVVLVLLLLLLLFVVLDLLIFD
jgi:hypothetical protein